MCRKWLEELASERNDSQSSTASVFEAKLVEWLEELVSQSNTIQAQEDITEQGRLQARSGRNYV